MQNSVPTSALIVFEWRALRLYNVLMAGQSSSVSSSTSQTRPHVLFVIILDTHVRFLPITDTTVAEHLAPIRERLSCKHLR